MARFQYMDVWSGIVEFECIHGDLAVLHVVIRGWLVAFVKMDNVSTHRTLDAQSIVSSFDYPTKDACTMHAVVARTDLARGGSF